MASHEQQNGKRRSSEVDDGGNSKHLKKEENVNNSSVRPSPDEGKDDEMDIDGTEEYELEDSEGFDFVESEEILAQNTQEFTYEEENIQTITPATSRGKLESSDDVELFKGSKSEIQGKANSSLEDQAKPSMTRIESVQKDAEVIKGVIPGIDVDRIYHRVLEKRDDKSRVQIVTNDILENELNTATSSGDVTNADSTSDKLFDEVAEIIIKYPNADPSVVYDLLHKYKDKTDRMQLVFNHLKIPSVVNSSSSSDNSSIKNSSVSVISSDKSSDLLHDPTFTTNPLYKDLKTLSKVLPDVDQNELYAYLEAHFDRPNRVQIVIDELTKSESQETMEVARLDSVEDLEKGKDPVTAEDRLQRNLLELKEIFPDCDPNYLYEKLNQRADDTDRVGKVAMELFEHKNYPKLKDVLENEQKVNYKEKLHKLKFNQTDFLAKFPDPVAFFGDINRHVNENYKTHVLVYLKNTYPFMKDGYIKKVLQKHNYHLSPAVTELEINIRIIGDRGSKKKRLTPRPELLDYPDDPEELFFHEVLYCQYRDQIKVYLKEKKREYQLKIETAREQGQLMECQCCFDDECLFEDMDTCTDGHLFCKQCIHRSCETAVGDGKIKFMCLTGTCDHQFPLKALQDILPANLFSLALRKMQEEELRQADIPDLVTCPFCSFATIMPDLEDRVFKCLNSDCLRESCRLCKEPNHIPLHCDEVEKQGETNMRAFIETKMSEAMLRTCASCKKRFYKESGCNKMTCTCGASMCYVCREPIADYNHFGPQKCPMDSDIFTLHKDEMLEAAEQARQQYLEDHPDVDGELKYDPVKLLEKMKKRWDGEDGDDDDDDGYADDEGYEDDDDDDDDDDYDRNDD